MEKSSGYHHGKSTTDIYIMVNPAKEEKTKKKYDLTGKYRGEVWDMPEIKINTSTYHDLLNKASQSTSGTVSENGDFKISASESISKDSKNMGASYTITGHFDPDTGKGECSITGNVNLSDTSGGSWTEGMNDEYKFKGSNNTHASWTISGNGTVKCEHSNAAGDPHESLSCHFDEMRVDRSGTADGHQYMKGLYASEWTEVDPGPPADLSDSWYEYFTVTLRK